MNSLGISTINTGWSSRSGRDMVESVSVAGKEAGGSTMDLWEGEGERRGDRSER